MSTLDIISVIATVVSSIAAVYTVQQTITIRQEDRKITIAIQNQSRELAWLPKRLELLQAIKDTSAFNADEFPFYFGADIVPLVKKFQQAKQEFDNAELKYNTFFRNLYDQELSSQNDPCPERLEKIKDDIDRFKQLADVYERDGICMSNWDEFKNFDETYPLYNPQYNSLPDDLPEEPAFFEYTKISNCYDEANKKFESTQSMLINELERILYASLNLAI